MAQDVIVTTTVGHHRLSIPVEVWQSWGLKEGDRIAWIQHPQGYLLLKQPKRREA